MSERDQRTLWEIEEWVRAAARQHGPYTGRARPSFLQALGQQFRDHKVRVGSAVWHRAMGYARGYLDAQAGAAHSV